jgi:hypothetical protein
MGCHILRRLFDLAGLSTQSCQVRRAKQNRQPDPAAAHPSDLHWKKPILVRVGDKFGQVKK